MLAVSNLTVNYGEVQAVDSISIKVKAGELVSITGANGAGKSSMLNAIAGICAVASERSFLRVRISPAYERTRL